MNTIAVFRGQYEFLSNFYRHTIAVDIGWGTLSYKTVEHAFQAAKAEIRQAHDEIRNQSSPGKAKSAGRSVQLVDGWDSNKDWLMMHLLREKFRDPSLKKLLLRTGDATLIEGNTWHDNYWGSCTCASCRAEKGSNMLGQALMTVRKESRIIGQ